MSTPPDPAPDVRIGNDERDAAMRALDEHLAAGRLDPDEYGDRVAKVSVARTFADLDPLFSDLPDPRPRPPAGEPVVLTKPAPRAPSTSGDRHSSALGGRVGETIVALSPFVAVLLFFLLPGPGWLAFLLVPMAGAVVYGDRHGHKNHNRRR